MKFRKIYLTAGGHTVTKENWEVMAALVNYVGGKKNIALEYELDYVLTEADSKVLHEQIKKSDWNKLDGAGKLRWYKIEYAGLAYSRNIIRVQYDSTDDSQNYEKMFRLIQTENDALLCCNSGDWFIDSIASLVLYFPKLLVEFGRNR